MLSKKRILITCSILVLTISILTFLWWKYGLFSDYNYFTAKEDIKKGNIRLLYYGLPAITSKDNEMEKVRAKYGFKDFNLGCGFTDEELRTTNIYNEVMEEYLEKRNGKNWVNNLKRELDSLYKIARSQDK